MFKLKIINFYKDFYEKNIISDFYENVYNNISLEDTTNYSKTRINLKEREIYIIFLIPEYIDLKFRLLNYEIGAFKVSTYKSFLSDFRNYKKFDEYFKSQLSSKRRKSLRSQLRKLDKCFDVNYKVYVGHIEKTEYDYLLDKLYEMIQKRFKQRGDIHASIANWSFYKNSVFKLINEGRACIVVINHNNKPIAISINYLKQNIFIGSIDSYDTDYSKFSLGNILMLKKTEWCFKNGYSALDTGWGDLYYKREWSNTIYKLKSHVLYKKNDFLSKITAYFISKMIWLKFILKQKLKPILINKISFLKKSKVIIESNEARFQWSLNLSSETSELKYLEGQSELDIESDENVFLRKYLYDFQYRTNENSKNIKIYKISKELNPDKYFFKGKIQSCVLNAV